MTDHHDDLIELGGRTPLGLYLREMSDRREFAIVVPLNDIRAQNMDNVLGQLWHLLNPLFLAGIYYLIFGLILDANRGVDDYVAFLVIGVLMFQLTQRVVQDCAMTISRNEGLIRSLQFPRALLPISSLVGQTVAYVPAIGIILMFALTAGEVGVKWLVFPFVLLAQAAINLGAGFIVSRAGFAVRDVAQILPHLFRLLFYVSGVIFSVDVFVDSGIVRRLFDVNPIFAVISAGRWSLMNVPMSTTSVLSLVVWSVGLPIVGLFYFRAAEHRYGA